MFADNHRTRFINTRSPLSDEDFVSLIVARPELYTIIIACREALARVCKIPAGFLYPDDKPELYLQFLTMGWDDMAVVFELEGILNIEIEDDDNYPTFLGWRFLWWKKPGPSSIGMWCIDIAEYLHTNYAMRQVG